MEGNELLDEMWRIKDELWRKANGDMDTFFAQLREETLQQPPPGPVIRDPRGVRAYFESEAAREAVRENPKTYGRDAE